MKKIIAGIVIGSVLTTTTSIFADSIEQYILTKVNYPLIVKGKEYTNADLPVLNYKGNTYVPLKAVGDVLGENVKWNDQLKQVEIGQVTSNETQSNETTKNETASNEELTVEQRQIIFQKDLEDKRQRFLDEYKAKGIELIDFVKLTSFCATRMISIGDASNNEYSLNSGGRFASDGVTNITYVLYKGVEYPYTDNVEKFRGSFGYLSSDYFDLAFIKKIVPQNILDKFYDAVKNKTWGMK